MLIDMITPIAGLKNEKHVPTTSKMILLFVRSGVFVDIKCKDN
jgi:hypothetical protein